MKQPVVITPEIMASLDEYRNTEEYQTMLSTFKKDVKKHKATVLKMFFEAKSKDKFD